MGDQREVVLSTLAKSFIRNLDNRRYYSTYVDVIRENQLFGAKKANPVHEVIAEVNTSLGSSKHRLEAVCLLQEIVAQCSPDVFSEHALTWLRLLTTALKSHDPPLTMEMTCGVTASVLGQTTGFSELSRQAASSVVPSLVPALLDMPTKHQEAALRCLAACMTHYPGPCGPFKNKIEAKVVPLLDGNHRKLEEVACACYQQVARCGGGGGQGVRYSEAWTVQTQRLMGSVNDTLSALLQAVHMGMEDAPDPPQRLVLTPVPTEEPARTCTLHARYTCLVNALITMLSNNFPAAVKVPLDDILQLVCRALSVTPKQVMFHATQERVLLCAVLPLLQAGALRLLRALITSCKSHLVVHGGTINKLFLQTLTWSQSAAPSPGHACPHSDLQTEVYETLSLWVQTAGAASGVEHVMTDLLTHWVRDVTPRPNVVKLDTRLTQKVDALMAGGKKRRRVAVAEPIVSQGTGSPSAGSEVCIAALQAMRHILLKVGPFLKAKHHKAIHSLIIPVLLDVQAGLSGGTVPAPYAGSGQARAALYAVLRATLLSPHPAVPSPLPTAARVFTRGLLDQHPEVMKECSESSAVAEALRHPRAPALSLPTEPAMPYSTPTLHSAQGLLGLYGPGSSAAGQPTYVYAVGGKAAPQPMMVLGGGSKPTEEQQLQEQRKEENNDADIEVVSVKSSGSSDEESGSDSGSDNNENGEEEMEDEDDADIIALEDDSQPKVQSNEPMGRSKKAHKAKESTSQDCQIIGGKPASSTTGGSCQEGGKPESSSKDIEKSLGGSSQQSGTLEGSTKETSPTPGGSSEQRKRKHQEETPEGDDETSAMLGAFVDAGPDSD